MFCEDLRGLAPPDLLKPLTTTLPLPTYWASHSSSKKLRVSQALSTCCSFCLEHCSPHQLHESFLCSKVTSLERLLPTHHLKN